MNSPQKFRSKQNKSDKSEHPGKKISPSSSEKMLSLSLSHTQKSYSSSPLSSRFCSCVELDRSIGVEHGRSCSAEIRHRNLGVKALKGGGGRKERGDLSARKSLKEEEEEDGDDDDDKLLVSPDGLCFAFVHETGDSVVESVLAERHIVIGYTVIVLSVRKSREETRTLGRGSGR